MTQNLADHKTDLENILHVAPNAFANAYKIYNADTGADIGAFVFNNFSSPVDFICGAIGAIENTTAPETAKLCAQYLGPALRLLNFNYLPIPVNPYLTQVDEPRQRHLHRGESGARRLGTQAGAAGSATGGVGLYRLQRRRAATSRVGSVRPGSAPAAQSDAGVPGTGVVSRGSHPLVTDVPGTASPTVRGHAAARQTPLPAEAGSPARGRRRHDRRGSGTGGGRRRVPGAAVSGCAFDGLNSLPLPGAVGRGPGPASTTSRSPMSRHGTEFAGDDRRCRGRQRQQADVHDWHADVEVSIKPGVVVPANAVARIGQTSLLGSLHL